ncbi:Eco57I restriction-modification methylase domain-containing protein [Bacillus haynesii]|uniref:site-specific DNA-methyltransferase (adenine-specific) n=1 Tax=Bacillus haynesii TaxID=1925021 RepID=A0AA90EWP6_9BACI|nr:N-6 DNA methylase [Bacillus haynesii]MCY7789383.1 SAM-dependent methyltransferase [Bacillus haynesii]MCY8382536.1 SAM-dependent methyltransferase [Bacillus haynesii]MCY8586985.1 SAM-dependent methyltransferase [Bacillus haynesii]MCY9280172.1 SAM-dependent methyltransferase [Bacillus haynesii]MCY9390181.1 SAM-dependent methyltransferase [Bacillus haynesii]
MKYKCQIFTPGEYVEKMLDSIDYVGEQVLGKYILENSCGEGNILIKIVKRYIEAAKSLRYSKQRIKKDLEKYILGYEIDKKVRNKCITNLNNEVKKYGISQVKWNIRDEDYLKHPIEEKVNFVVGNPPYVMYQNLELNERKFLKKNFLSCSKGKFDYCYAFIEKSIRELNVNGRMAYIVPNSIFKNVFGKELRDIMKSSLETIYDYKQSVVFDKVLTSPAIICLNNIKRKTFITYHDVDNQEIYQIEKSTLGDKWLFSPCEADTNSVSSKKFGDFFRVSNSVATLLNSAYVISKKDILKEDKHYIELNGFRIEKDVLRFAASPRSYSINREEYIIFPYDYSNGKLVKFEEEEFKVKYPGAYNYLLSYSMQLKLRKSDKSSKWFEYGRSQALLHLNQEKILLSSVVTNEVNTYRLDKDTIPYSGFFIIPIANMSLDEADKILKSEKFFTYLSLRGINANGKSLRFSVNDIMNYSIN